MLLLLPRLIHQTNALTATKKNKTQAVTREGSSLTGRRALESVSNSAFQNLQRMPTSVSTSAIRAALVRKDGGHHVRIFLQSLHESFAEMGICRTCRLARTSDLTLTNLLKRVLGVHPLEALESEHTQTPVGVFCACTHSARR